jgi:glutamate synthase (NADPH/NADH) small chain
MANKPYFSVNGRPLNQEQIRSNFNDLHQPLNQQQALAESDRCLYCYDAPCIQACPTSIDIPTFIHQIRSDNVQGAAKTILSENIMGGTCARVCPTEVLCEQVCVLNTSIEQTVEIGALQRYAVDKLITDTDQHPFKPARNTGKNIAIVGAGPAGLACAHRSALLGHNISIYEAKDKAGGLNEYGLAAYKMVDDFAQKEADFITSIGNIEIKYKQTLGGNLSLKQLQDKYDAIFIGIGLGKTQQLGLGNETLKGIYDAVDFIEKIRQANDKSQVQVGQNVVVIGAGNTAIDAAVAAKRLGAENVSLVYRRGEQQMSATQWEIDLARSNGVVIKLWSAPNAIIGQEQVTAIEFNRTESTNGQLLSTADSYTLKTDMILKAIGQKLDANSVAEIQTDRGKIIINNNYETNIKGIYAGGDAINSGEDLTVQAVEDGKQAAHAIDAMLKEEN